MISQHGPGTPGRRDGGGKTAMAGKFIVRHSAMRHLGEFEAGYDIACGRGARVIVHSDRGHEIGDVLC
jgi:hypothetical protein